MSTNIFAHVEATRAGGGSDFCRLSWPTSILNWSDSSQGGGRPPHLLAGRSARKPDQSDGSRAVRDAIHAEAARRRTDLLPPTWKRPTGPLIRGYGGSKLLQHNALQGRRADRGVHDCSESTPGCHLYRAGQRSQAAHCCRCTCVIARAMQICTRAARLWPLTLDGPRPRLGDDRNSVEPGCVRCTRPF